jgi:hypothetical protein
MHTFLFYIIGPNGTRSSVDVSFIGVLQAEKRKIMEAGVYYCLTPYMCGGRSTCNDFSSYVEVMKYVDACLIAEGLVDDLGYPTNTSTSL